jgi:hypothetical protein
MHQRHDGCQNDKYELGTFHGLLAYAGFLGFCRTWMIVTRKWEIVDRFS